MKRIMILALALVTVTVASAQKTTLSGTVGNLPPGAALVISMADGGRLLPVDTITPDAKGHYRIEREVADELFFTISLTQPRGPMVHVILLPKEKVTLDLFYNVDLNFLVITSTKGSQNMRMYQQYNNMVADAAGDEAKQAAIAAGVESLLRENKSELMSAFMVTFFESAFDQYYDLYKAIRDATKPLYPNNGFVRHIDQKVSSVIATGAEAPDIVLPDPDGKERKLSDLRGKVVLIDFWASWCRPCRAENPNVVRLYHKYKDRGFEVFSVSLDQDYNKWVDAIKADGLVWPNHVSDLKGWSSAGGRLYGIMSIPATVLVDSEGRVVARNLRGPQLEQKLKEIFGQ